MQTFFIRDLETARVAFRPPRPAVIERLRQAMTVAELAASLGEPASRLYYHVNELERVGLVEVVDVRDRGNLREKVYRVIAPSIRVDPAVFQSGADGGDLLQETVLTILAAAGDAFRRAARADQVSAAAAGSTVHSHDELRLSAADAAELTERARALVEEFRARGRAELPVSVQLTALVIPIEPAP
jgi:DNA-binding transcriptional ArsR family regulator